jgi:Mrp family chromosome partitioning ATPase
MQQRLASIEQIVMVVANKGGVGKSTVAANLAASLAARGLRVGVADADIHGPNQSRFLGHVGARVRVTGKGLETCSFEHPACAHTIAVASLAFLNQREDAPVVWRDAYKHDFIHHLMGSFAWPELDFLIIDMPPGTGNELITLCDLLEGSEVVSVLVTTPQSVALMDTMKMATFCHERGMPILGVVENMAGITCPACGEDFHLFPRDQLDEALCAANLNTLARLPLSPALARSSDEGIPEVLNAPSGEISNAMARVTRACRAHVKARRADINAGALADVLSQNLASDAMQTALNTLDPESRSLAGQQLETLLTTESNRISAAAPYKRISRSTEADTKSAKQ